MDLTLADEPAISRLRVMVVLLSPNWLGAARLPAVLTQAGFSVASYCHPESYLSNTRYNEYAYTAPTSGSAFPNLVASVRQYQPVLLIPACELAVRFLHNIDAEQKAGRLRAEVSDVVDLVRRSLGDPEGHRRGLSKIETHAVAREAGLSVPRQERVANLADARAFAAAVGYPVVIKAEYGCAGSAVHICGTAAELDAAFQSLLSAEAGQRLLIEQFIEGTIASQPSVSLAGEMLETITVVKERTHPGPTGPSSVLRPIICPDAEQATRALVKQLGISGFSSAGFMIDGQGRAHLIEFNPRPVPGCTVSHLWGRSHARALWSQLVGVPHVREPVAEPLRPVALFPNEWLRDRSSPYLFQAYHDVPWRDPALVKAYLQAYIK
jgi:carbamoyl-phosphate synthase large subunit